MPEWPIGTALKAVVGRPTAGSNPAPSAVGCCPMNDWVGGPMGDSLLRATQVHSDRVVGQIVDPLTVMLQVGQEAPDLACVPLRGVFGG